MNNGKDIGTPEHRLRGRGRKAFWISIAAVLAIALMFSSHNQRQFDHRFPGDWSSLTDREIERALDAIDATPEQRALLAPEFERTRIEIRNLAIVEQELRQRLNTVLEADEPDPAEVSALRTQTIALGEAAIDLAFDSTLAIWAELRDDQRTALLNRWRSRETAGRNR